MNELEALKQFAVQSQIDLETQRGFLAIILKSQGGVMRVRRSESEVTTPFHVVMRTIRQNDDEELSLEFKLLEGQEEIEAIMGKPSPIILPK